jgi:hypothetical protein
LTVAQGRAKLIKESSDWDRMATRPQDLPERMVSLLRRSKVAVCQPNCSKITNLRSFTQIPTSRTAHNVQLCQVKTPTGTAALPTQWGKAWRPSRYILEEDLHVGLARLRPASMLLQAASPPEKELDQSFAALMDVSDAIGPSALAVQAVGSGCDQSGRV